MRQLQVGSIAALALTLTAATGATPAARVGDETIPLSRVDAATRGKTEQLLARLHEVASQALDARIDAHLLAGAELAPIATPEVSDDAIDAFRAARADDFEGPQAPGGPAGDPAVQRAAIRHYLESQAQQQARAQRVATLRTQHATLRELPEAEALAAPLAPRRVVARIDGEPLYASELETHAALRLYWLRGELARERIRSAQALASERLLAREADRRGTNVQAMLEAETRPPDADDLRAFQQQEQAAGRPAPDPERARPLLAFRAQHAARERLLDAARRHDEVAILIAEPAPPRLPVVAAGAPALGAPDGLRLVAYTNYRCDVCRAVHGEIDRLLAASTDVRVVFRDWIPHYDPAAREAAALARCAEQQGRFAPMRRALLEAPPPGFGGGYDAAALAVRTGADAQALRACLAGDVQREIDADSESARALGFESAPAFVAEGVPLAGAQSAAALARALRDALAPPPSRGR